LKVLAANNLVKIYGGKAAVNNVSLEVGACEIVGLLGPNGAGKTTMINMLLGVLTPDSGHIVVFYLLVSRHELDWQKLC
jgi:ABC-type multidrug transport system ATPase subunit